ncbi:MAG: DUF1797 family protein [Limosilactobacillus sp.]|uniref:DUF1797 family protein n=1 Tax=Limosilactobacillus sp. TaxID=2773925 RepID=UPI00270A71E6|nr:DUF1797 family protein [Limosilactobacillus sp.]
MEQSQLVSIIRRLDAMKRDQSGKRQKRTFEQFGIPVCEVIYHGSGDDFTLVLFRPAERFRFDNIDLIAIEIFEALYDLQQTF